MFQNVSSLSPEKYSKLILEFIIYYLFIILFIIIFLSALHIPLLNQPKVVADFPFIYCIPSRRWSRSWDPSAIKLYTFPFPRQLNLK